MIVLGLICFAVGLFLSALFSGSETGFYRVARLRLRVAAVTGDWISQAILWVSYHPSLFIATALVGNNLANYLLSFATVLLAQAFTASPQGWTEILATMIMAPVAFVLGELLPKRLFLLAPFTLLRYAGPLFLVFTVVLAPVSVILWIWNRFLALLIPTPPEIAQSQIRGWELRHIVEEGEHAGLMTNSQVRLANVILQAGTRPIKEWMHPLGELATVPLDAPPEKNAELLCRGKRFLLVTHPQAAHRVVGYVDLAQWVLMPDRPLREVTRPFLRVLPTERLVSVLQLMYQHGQKLALVIDGKDQAVGIVWEQELRRFCLTSS